MKAWMSGWIPWTVAVIAGGLLAMTTLQLRTMTQGYAEQVTLTAKFRDQALEQTVHLSQITSNLEVLVHAAQAQAEELRGKSQQQMADLAVLKESNLKLLDERGDLLKKMEQAQEELRAQLARQESQVATLQRLADERKNRLDVVLDAGSRLLLLSDPTGQSKVAGRVYWHGEKKAGIVTIANLEPVIKGQGRCLEVWVKCGTDGYVPAGLGWTDDSGWAVLEVKPAKQMPCVELFAVTIETGNGSAIPNGRMILESR